MAISAFQQKSEPLLLQKARFIMLAPQWQEEQWTVGDYDWWNQTEFVGYFEDPYEQRNPTRKQLYDLKGKEVDGKAPTWLEHGMTGNFSPDRKMMVSEEWRGKDIHWTVTDTVNRQILGAWTMKSRTPEPLMDESTGYWPPKVSWSEDSRSLYQIETWPAKNGSFQVEVTQRKLGALANGHPFPIVKGLDFDAEVYVHEGKAMVYYDNRDDARAFPIKEWELAHPSTTMRVWKPRAPNGHVIGWCIPSPNFKRALWMLAATDTPGDPEWHGLPYKNVSLWAGGLHGENMRELGAISFAGDKAGADYQNLGGFEWNPDCKRVSFIYYRKLYWISTE